LSLKVALKRLGFGPCYHAVEVMRHAEHQPLWDAAFAGNPDWEQIFAGYRATVDFPGAAFWQELVDTYPNAKVILTVREPHKWYASVRDTSLQAAGPDSQPPIPGASDDASGDQQDWSQMMANLQDERTAVADFERHIADVRTYAPEHRLLVYDVTQGWTPLCEFLGVDVPDEPFPRLNASEAFHELLDDIDSARHGQSPD